MNKILFPTDYSKASDNAFRYALKIAEKTQAEIVTLHVFQKPDVGRAKYSSTMKDIYVYNEMEELEKSMEDAKHLNELAEKEGLSHILTNHVLEEGEVVSTILEVAAREEVDIIIIGSNGKSGFTEQIYGSNAAGVLERANIFVLTVPEEAKFDKDFRRIIIATTFSDLEKKAMQYFLDFASKYELEVICVHVGAALSKEEKKKVEDWKTTFGNKIARIDLVISDEIIETLNEYVLHNNADMIAMLTKRRPFFTKLFSRSLTKRMVYHKKMPVLALQEHAIK